MNSYLMHSKQKSKPWNMPSIQQTFDKAVTRQCKALQINKCISPGIMICFHLKKKCDPFICSNIPAAPAYEVYISQLIRYSRYCCSYHNFLDGGLLLTRKLLKQGFLLVNLKSSLRTFHGRRHHLVNRCVILMSQITTDMVPLSQWQFRSFLIQDLTPQFWRVIWRVALVE